MSVITLSRQLGCHGEEIAAEVAEALGLRLIDAATISRAAEKAGVPQVAVAELENEGARSLADQVLTALRTMPSLYTASAQLGSSTGKEGIGYPGASGLTIPFTGLFSPTVSPISASLQSYVYMVSMVIRGLAREGNVLIVGRGGQVLLRKHRRAMHVQVVAPMGNRIEELMSARIWSAGQLRAGCEPAIVRGSTISDAITVSIGWIQHCITS